MFLPLVVIEVEEVVEKSNFFAWQKVSPLYQGCSTIILDSNILQSIYCNCRLSMKEILQYLLFHQQLLYNILLVSKLVSRKKYLKNFSKNQTIGNFSEVLSIAIMDRRLFSVVRSVFTDYRTLIFLDRIRKSAVSWGNPRNLGRRNARKICKILLQYIAIIAIFIGTVFRYCNIYCSMFNNIAIQYWTALPCTLHAGS